MLKYQIINKPVLVRDRPIPDSNIVNVLNPGKIIYVLKLDSGWYRLKNGYYVLKTDNIKLFTETEDLPDLEDASSTFRSNQRSYSYDPSTNPGGQNGNNVTPGNARSANNALNLNPNSNVFDTASGEDTRLSVAQLNEKYTGPNTQWVGNPGLYAYEVDANGMMVMENNQPKKIQMPDTLLGKNNGSTVIAIDDRGYVTVQDLNGRIYVVEGTQGSISVDPNSDNYQSLEISEEMIANRDVDSVYNFTAKLEQGFFDDLFGSVVNLNKVDTSNYQSIFGYPYQFRPEVDPRIVDIGKREIANFVTIENLTQPGIIQDLLTPNKLGRQFTRKIAGRAPILTIQPGIPVFLKGYDGSIKEKVLTELAGIADATGISKISLEEVINSSGRYYSFKETPDQYFEAVNAVCRAMSIFLTIDEIPASLVVPGFEPSKSSNKSNDKPSSTTLADINWRDCAQHNYAGYYLGAVNFYLNAEPQIHEQFTNATRPSQLAGAVNQISDQAMEMQFLLGGVGAAAGGSFDWPRDGISNLSENLANNDNSSFTRSGAGLVNSMVKNIRTFLSGGKMIFPEIWADSTFGRSYNITIKLISPDCDRISIFLNILVPLAHILGFVLPRSVGDNSYISPFLVRCWYKSQFNIELGIVSSCEVIKGDAGCWTQDGLPTQVIVQMSIKDLYSVMSYALNNSFSNILSNPAQINYIANMCGVNIGPTDIRRTLTLWWMLTSNRYADALKNFLIYSRLQQISPALQTLSGVISAVNPQ